MSDTANFISIERRIERSTLDDLLAQYTSEKEKRRVLEIRIHTSQERLTQDESLELVDAWEKLDDDCQALSRAIADRLTDPTYQKETELLFA